MMRAFRSFASIADKNLVKGDIRVRSQGVRTADGTTISRITPQ
jgi:hypothetical protein